MTHTEAMLKLEELLNARMALSIKTFENSKWPSNHFRLTVILGSKQVISVGCIDELYRTIRSGAAVDHGELDALLWSVFGAVCKAAIEEIERQKNGT